LLKGADVSNDAAKTTEANKDSQEETAEIGKAATTAVAPSQMTRSPKRKASDSNVAGLVVITPARNTVSSPSSFGESSDSDGDQNNSVLPKIPKSFPSRKFSNKLPQPQASRVGSNAATTPSASLDFAARLPPKKYMLQQKNADAAVITPLKTKGPEYIEREKGPNFPILMGGVGSLKK